MSEHVGAAISALPLLFGGPLFIALVTELLVALLLGVKRRGIQAVIFVNLVTSPLVTAIVVGLDDFGVTFVSGVDVPGAFWLSPLATVLTIVMESLVILGEWRLLLWALGDGEGSSRRLLGLSVAMNLSSWAVGSLFLSLFS